MIVSLSLSLLFLPLLLMTFSDYWSEGHMMQRPRPKLPAKEGAMTYHEKPASVYMCMPCLLHRLLLTLPLQLYIYIYVSIYKRRYSCYA
jgi:hypothetical protein